MLYESLLEAPMPMQAVVCDLRHVWKAEMTGNKKDFGLMGLCPGCDG